VTVEPVRPEHAPELVRLADEWGQCTFQWTADAAGIVVRDDRGIAGFALLTNRPYGHIVEELWCEHTRRGLRATSAIIDWVEAQERHRGGQVGGIVSEGNPLYGVLRERGYAVTHHVLTKSVA
jgi:hypothetical protein